MKGGVDECEYKEWCDAEVEEQTNNIKVKIEKNPTFVYVKTEDWREEKSHQTNPNGPTLKVK